MRTVLTIGLVLFTSGVLWTPAAARDIFVDNLAGDDTYTGHQAVNVAGRRGPVRSIGKALRLAGPGDRIVLKNTGEPYRESISLVGSRHSGSIVGRFTIAGGGAILDGSAPVPLGNWEHHDGSVFRFRPPRLEYLQLFLEGRPAAKVTVDRLAEAPPSLEPLEWCLHGGYVYFCVEWMKLPQDYALTYSDKRVGITLFHVRQVAISNLTVQGFQLDGINAHNSARDVVVRNVTCRGNGRSGVAVGGASLVDLSGCLLGDNGRAQLLTLRWSETHLRNSELLPNTAPALVREGGRVYVEGRLVEEGSDAS